MQESPTLCPRTKSRSHQDHVCRLRARSKNIISMINVFILMHINTKIIEGKLSKFLNRKFVSNLKPLALIATQKVARSFKKVGDLCSNELADLILIMVSSDVVCCSYYMELGPSHNVKIILFKIFIHIGNQHVILNTVRHNKKIPALSSIAINKSCKRYAHTLCRYIILEILLQCSISTV